MPVVFESNDQLMHEKICFSADNAVRERKVTIFTIGAARFSLFYICTADSTSKF